MNQTTYGLSAVLLTLLLGACGGGGSNSKTPSHSSAANTFSSTQTLSSGTFSSSIEVAPSSSALVDPSSSSSLVNASTAPDGQSSSRHSHQANTSSSVLSSHLSSTHPSSISSTAATSQPSQATSSSSPPPGSSASSRTGLSSSSVSSSSSLSPSSIASTSSTGSATAADLQTWWHTSFAENASNPVADNQVRRSTIYDVTVSAPSNEKNKYNSFVYMSIPRAGKSKQILTDDDGAEFASKANLTMSWSSFLYNADTWVQVDVKDGKVINSIDEVRIRPTTLHFAKELLSPTSVRIKVPFNESGYRFSVELDAELMTSHANQLGRSGTLTENPQDAIVHTEPRNALLIFAEPMLNASQQAALVPTPASGSIYYPTEGEVNLNNLSEKIIYFKPGIYHMPANSHAKLPANVNWVYLAPGAYVKGAFEFSSGNSDYKLTGFGIISGEKYVYAPNKDLGYAQSPGKCDGPCLRLLQFSSADKPQSLQMHGITLNEPPFNSIAVWGNAETFATHVSHYKQVGSWYYQTDGIEVYAGGSLKNAFFHSNDDVVKMYHSNTRAENIVIWKGENGPAIQFGWASRNISNIQVKDVDIIHNRMYWKDQKPNTCIINSMDLYDENTPIIKDRLSLDHTINDVEFKNIRSEGKNLCAMRFIALSNWQSIAINGLEIEDWNDLATDSQLSLFSVRSVPGTPPNLFP